MSLREFQYPKPYFNFELNRRSCPSSNEPDSEKPAAYYGHGRKLSTNYRQPGWTPSSHISTTNPRNHAVGP